MCNRNSKTAELLKSSGKTEGIGDDLFPGFSENFF